MTEALRSVYADFGISADDRQLLKVDAAIDAVTAKLQSLVSGKGFSGSGVFAKLQNFVAAGGKVTADAMAAIGADDAIQTARAQKVVDLRKAAVEAIEAERAALQLLESADGAHLDTLRRENALRREAAEHALDMAHRATPQGRQQAMDRFRRGAQTERADHEETKAVHASPEGQAHAQWQRLAAEADAAKKPITGVADAFGRLSDFVAKRFGGSLAKHLGLDGLIGKLGLTNQGLGKLVLGVTGWAVAGLGLAAHAVFSFADGFTQTSEALRETARAARVTSSELQALQHAGTASGVGADRVTSSVTALAGRLRDADLRMGGGGVGGTLRRLGIQMRDTSGHVRPTTEILDELAVSLEHVSSPRRRVRIVESLGLDRRMLDILHTGEGGIAALRREMEELGGGVQPEATAAAHRYALAQERLKIATTSLRSVLFTQLAPALEWLVLKGGKLLGWASRMARGSHLVQVGFVAVGAAGVAAGTALAAAWLPVVAPVLGVGAAIALAALAADDLWNFLEGNHSALGLIVDDLFGVGASVQFVELLTETWRGFSDGVARTFDFIDRLPPALRAVFAPLRALRSAYQNVTGTDEGAGSGGESTGFEESTGPRGAGGPRSPRGGRQGATRGQPGLPAPASAPTPAQLGFDGRPVGTVPAPAAAGRVVHTHQHAGDRNTFHVTGADPRTITSQIETILDRRDRQRRDGQHPQESE